VHSARFEPSICTIKRLQIYAFDGRSYWPFVLRDEFVTELPAAASATFFSASLVVPCGQTDRQTDRHTHRTKLIVAFSNFANGV
jgi:hypothetical protein